MIKSFSCKETEKIFNGEKSKKFAAIARIAKRKLDMIHFSHAEQDLKVPPANRLERLKGNLRGYCSIRVNDQYRIIFKFSNSAATKVRITDYH